jgi:Domain of Unknown Function (DUF928)
MKDKLFCLITIASVCSSSLLIPYMTVHASIHSTQEVATRRRGKLRGGGLSPGTCGGRVLKALIEAENITSVRSNQAAIQFYIPCSPREIERLEFSIIALPQERNRRTSTSLTITDTPGYYTHTFEIPEKNKEYRWYLKLMAKNPITGEIETDYVSAFIQWVD